MRGNMKTTMSAQKSPQTGALPGAACGPAKPGAAVAASVLRILGRPQEKIRIDVHPLWNNRYRVNVLLGEESTYTRIAHSYFVSTDADGNVLTATPPILRAY